METCDNCGACCREQESPPGYVAILCGMDWPDSDDVERVRSMPVELRAGLRQCMLDDCRHEHSPACLWYDHERRACRNYDWRPSVCRDFAAGSEECHGWRRLYQIEVPHAEAK